MRRIWYLKCQINSIKKYFLENRNSLRILPDGITAAYVADGDLSAKTIPPDFAYVIDGAAEWYARAGARLTDSYDLSTDNCTDGYDEYEWIWPPGGQSGTGFDKLAAIKFAKSSNVAVAWKIFKMKRNFSVYFCSKTFYSNGANDALQFDGTSCLRVVLKKYC